jgi:hypothetical protein
VAVEGVGYGGDCKLQPGTGGEGAFGAPVVGPNGLLEILETARGLGAPAAANVVRIAAFRAALEWMEGPPRFWSRSLENPGDKLASGSGRVI